MLAQTPAPQAPAGGAKPQAPGASAPPPPLATQTLPGGITVTLSTDESSAQVPSVPPDHVLITVGDEKITAAEFDRILETLPPEARPRFRGSARRQFAENIVRVKLLAQEARRRKLDESDAFRTQLKFHTDNLLANLEVATTKPDEADVRKYYEQHKSEYERVRVRHILIRMKGSPVPNRPEARDLSEDEALAKANEIRKKLLAGEDFAALAKSESDDTGSAARGGELGFVVRGQTLPSFEQAAFRLGSGEISEPVKTQFGYHIIQVEERVTKTFEEIRPDLEKRMVPEIAQKTVDELRKKTAVSLDPDYFSEKK